ncbi:hypothetical protein PT974_01813 [Cladobotryum mycophilum]|uniref:Uncharacterized protein n=1 Tax=Cladobotryum mycophilum TaxID=491253 RepID=A0ABR0SWE0_9HYPO
MQLIKLLPLAIATLAAAQDAPFATIYGDLEFKGVASEVTTTDCVSTVPLGFTGGVNSIIVDGDNHIFCQLFSDDQCQDIMRTFTAKVPSIYEGDKLRSVQCAQGGLPKLYEEN